MVLRRGEFGIEFQGVRRSGCRASSRRLRTARRKPISSCMRADLGSSAAACCQAARAAAASPRERAAAASDSRSRSCGCWAANRAAANNIPRVMRGVGLHRVRTARVDRVGTFSFEQRFCDGDYPAGKFAGKARIQWTLYVKGEPPHIHPIGVPYGGGIHTRSTAQRRGRRSAVRQCGARGRAARQDHLREREAQPVPDGDHRLRRRLLRLTTRTAGWIFSWSTARVSKADGRAANAPVSRLYKNNRDGTFHGRDAGVRNRAHRLGVGMLRRAISTTTGMTTCSSVTGAIARCGRIRGTESSSMWRRRRE